MSQVQPLCMACTQERQQFRADHKKQSPGCAALWRLAVQRNNDAWGCWQHTFTPWLTRLCDTAIRQAPPISGLSAADLPDLVQDIWHNLWRYMVRNSTAALALVADDDLSRVIGVIKTTVKNRAVELWRGAQSYTEPLPADEGAPDDEQNRSRRQLPAVDPPATEGFLDLLALLRKHIQTTKEVIVAEIILLQGMKPQDVFDLYPNDFTDVTDVNQTRQTLLRRIRNDPARPKSSGSASLEFRLLDHNEVHMNGLDTCPFDEGILLDYLHGHVDAAVKAAIEGAPACVGGAAALQTDLTAWRPALHALLCPPGETLVAYQERRLHENFWAIHAHIQRCPACQAELAMLATLDEVPLQEAPSLVRRLYELLFQPATLSPVPVLGEGSYRTIERTPQIELLVRTTKAHGRQRSWTLFGRLRYEDDQPVSQVTAIVMQDLEDEEANKYSTTAEENGTFIIKGLSAGIYQLRIVMNDEELVLNHFQVGEIL